MSNLSVLKRSIVTEKTTSLGSLGKYVFVVCSKATKFEVKDAVEKFFNVKVVSVNSMTRVGKKKRFRGHWGKRSDTKRAIVTLAEGNEIDLFSEVK